MSSNRCAAALAGAVGLLLVLGDASPCAAFFSNGRWTSTATDAATGPPGTSATLSWSIVPDGTPLSIGGTSNLVAFFDGLFGAGPGGSNLSLRPWFSLVDQSFDRWTELGGLTYLYEPADDGAMHGSAAGLLGTRGDIRLAGKFLDGLGGTNAQAGFIPAADITIDTGDAAHFGNSNANYLNLRNTLMHEVGHTVGLAHTNTNTSNFLMQPFSSTLYDGPQFDDIRGLQSLYGDANERVGGGNNTIGAATPLGPLSFGQLATRGGQAGMDAAVLPSETDFLSIANSSDVDYYSFTIAAPALIDVTLTPLGPSFNERPGGSGPYTPVNAAFSSNLGLEVYSAPSGTPLLLAAATSHPAGAAESVVDLALAAGKYFVRIAGASDTVQLYQLDVLARQPPLAGDFDFDHDVDGADFLVWQRGLGPGGFDAADLTEWSLHYGVAAGLAAGRSVPEPVGAAVVLGPWVAILLGRRRGPSRAVSQR